ncbi:hypothetical protein J6590_021099 [Homalodisca vitripennis]|nr:hypothetical protein J6590_021099 [Homalodisca vitripennis]
MLQLSEVTSKNRSSTSLLEPAVLVESAEQQVRHEVNSCPRMLQLPDEPSVLLKSADLQVLHEVNSCPRMLQLSEVTSKNRSSTCLLEPAVLVESADQQVQHEEPSVLVKSADQQVRHEVNSCLRMTHHYSSTTASAALVTAFVFTSPRAVKTVSRSLICNDGPTGDRR